MPVWHSGVYPPPKLELRPQVEFISEGMFCEGHQTSSILILKSLFHPICSRALINPFHLLDLSWGMELKTLLLSSSLLSSRREFYHNLPLLEHRMPQRPLILCRIILQRQLILSRMQQEMQLLVGSLKEAEEKLSSARDNYLSYRRADNHMTLTDEQLLLLSACELSGSLRRQRCWPAYAVPGASADAYELIGGGDHTGPGPCCAKNKEVYVKTTRAKPRL